MCKQRVFKNSLIIATQAPDELAYHLMKSPGYMSTISGEVVHIDKCISIEVKFRQIDQYYLQIPIHKGNDNNISHPSYTYNNREENRNKLQYFPTINILFK